MEKLLKALDTVKQRKKLLDEAIAEMNSVVTAQQAKVDAAQRAHEDAQQTASTLHAEFQEQVSALLPASSRSRSA